MGYSLKVRIYYQKVLNSHTGNFLATNDALKSQLRKCPPGEKRGFYKKVYRYSKGVWNSLSTEED